MQAEELLLLLLLLEEYQRPCRNSSHRFLCSALIEEDRVKYRHAKLPGKGTSMNLIDLARGCRHIIPVT
jgi:hypothetical protein